MNKPDTWKGYLAVVTAALLWAVAGIAVKFMFNTRSYDPIALVQFRMTLTCLVTGLTLAVVRPGLLRVRRADLPFIAAYGTLGLALNQATYYLAMSVSSVAVVIFLQFLAPVFTAVYEVSVQKARARPVTYAVLGLAIGGALLLVLGRDGGGTTTSAAGVVLGLASAVSLSFSSLLGRAGVRRMNSWTLLFWGMGAGSLMWAVVRPPWIALAQPLLAADWTFFGYLAVFSGALPFGLGLVALRYISATSALIAGSLEPVGMALLAYAVLGEQLGAWQVAGCGLILAAIVALQAVPGAALEVEDRSRAAQAP